MLTFILIVFVSVMSVVLVAFGWHPCCCVSTTTDCALCLTPIPRTLYATLIVNLGGGGTHTYIITLIFDNPDQEATWQNMLITPNWYGTISKSADCTNSSDYIHMTLYCDTSVNSGFRVSIYCTSDGVALTPNDHGSTFANRYDGLSATNTCSPFSQSVWITGPSWEEVIPFSNYCHGGTSGETACTTISSLVITE